jgi:radical SAM protein with 4Fe4S-binding SPASM domain
MTEAAKKSGGKKGPRAVGWEITTQCNLTCPHCYSAAAKRPHNEMNTDECKRVIDSLEWIGAGEIGWTGGEPLLRDDLEELIAYASAKGINSSITTNGVLLNEKRAIILKEAGNRAIQISLDGSTPEKNYRMRRATEDEFNKIIEAIRICGRLNIKVYLASLLGQETLEDAPEMVKLAKREGLDAIRFCGYTPAGRGKSADIKQRLNFAAKLVELHKFIDEAQADDNIIAMFDPGFGPTPPGYYFHECIAGKDIFYIKANGDIHPCTSLLNKQFRVGNLRERPLEEIWNDPEIVRMAENQGKNLHGFCRDCDNLANCHGACRGAVLAHTGDLNASFPVCLYQVAREACIHK